MAVRTLVVESWRSVPHSYAIVNQHHCLELLRRPGLRLLHRDLPFHRPWQPVAGLFAAEEEEALRAIPAPGPGDEPPDAVLRLAFPYDLTPTAAARTLVFGTAEFNVLAGGSLAGEGTLAEGLARSDRLTVITPSEWSREGFLNSGADPDRVVVVPHGFDERLYTPPAPEERVVLRARLKLDGFVFLHIGAMTANKGMAPLFRAFAAVAARHPEARLLAKGLDALYGSRDMLLRMLGKDLLSAEEVALIQPRILYLGQTLPATEMACLYKAADAYVSPYLGEGFNMPVMEAAACGLPVICTRGGATDDFVTDDFALRIDAQRRPAGFGSPPGTPATLLEPSVEHLVTLMSEAIERPAIAERARSTGPAYLRDRFTWRHVVDRLLQVAFP